MLSIGSNAAVPAQAQIKVQAARREAEQAQRTLAGLETGLQQQSRFNPTPATVGRLVDAFA